MTSPVISPLLSSGPRIGLGCMSLSHAYGVPPSPADGERMLRAALDDGIRILDTATLYGGGRNEELVGRAIAGRRHEVFLASKGGMALVDGVRTIDGRPSTLHSQVDASLTRLGVDHIDLYYLHRWDKRVPITDSVGALVEAVEAGKIGAIGLSEVSVTRLREAQAVAPIAAVQNEYSLWTRNAEIGMLEATRSSGVAFVAFSPLARGFLADTIAAPEDLPEEDIRRAMPRFQPAHWLANAALLPAWHLPTPTPQFTRAADGATGDSIALGLAAGGALGPDHDDNGFWFPSSIGRRKDGSLVVFPHIWDRAKPGIVAVAASGRRFVDESVSYHRFVRAMYRTQATDQAVPAWLIIDARSLYLYGLGMIRPHTPTAFLRKYVTGGYIHRAESIRALAEQIDVDPDGLEQTVRTNNRAATTGVDEQFGKGTSPFGHQYGDPRRTPNVNLGPIENGPFYALPLVPTPLGTALGLRIDVNARVLDADGRVVPGLYAAGNDADSPMAAEYPGAGGQVGAGMTFGYIAATDAASRDSNAPRDDAAHAAHTITQDSRTHAPVAG